MDTNLIGTLKTYGFGEKEAKVYLSALELGNSLASTIARRAEVNRATAYSILNDFKREGIVIESIQNDTKYYSVISPEVLFKRQEEKYEKMKSDLPELLALANKLGNRPRTQFYEGFEGLKKVFESVVLEGKTMKVPYLSFVGTTHMDPKFQKWLATDFQRMRQKVKVSTKAIQSASKQKDEYVEYHKKNYTAITIPEDVLNLSNEIVIYGENKVAILMYKTDEMSGLIIESQTLHDGLTSLFNLLWSIYKGKKKK